MPPAFTGLLCIGLIGVTFSTDLALTGFQSATMWLVVFGLLALLPGVGVVTFDELADTDFSIIFFLGAVFAIGAGLSETGFAATAAESLLTVVPTQAPSGLSSPSSSASRSPSPSSWRASPSRPS